MTVASRRARGMSGMAIEWQFQFDHATPDCDNVRVVRSISCLSRRAGCSDFALPGNMNPATSLGLSPTARMKEPFRRCQAGSIDSTKGDS